MKKNPRDYKIQSSKEMMDVGNILNYNGATIFDLSNISDEAERVEKVAFALDQILEHFDYQDDSEKLKLLLVLEEAHLWTLKEVGKEAIKFLDKAVRLLRKKGVGVMMISHKISDFDAAMRSAMNISVFFRTKYEGDLNRISKILGSNEMAKIIPKLPVGYSVFHLADIGEAFVVGWRSIYSLY
jgi:DNA helicase HerA-like ATPase